MKTFIISIAGSTGLPLAKILATRGDEVDGLHRRKEQRQQLTKASVSGTMGDLVSMSEQDRADAMAGSDAVVFSAGDGVLKTIAAARLAGVRRVYLVSMFPEAWRERHMDESFENYIRVTRRADVALSQSGLDWVIVRPSELRSDAGTGKIDIGVAQFTRSSSARISRRPWLS